MAAPRGLIAQHPMDVFASAAASAGIVGVSNLRPRGRRGNLHAGRDHDLLRHFWIARSDVIVTAAVVESSHHGRVSPANRAHNASLGPAVGADVANLHQHAVAVHGGTDKAAAE